MTAPAAVKRAWFLGVPALWFALGLVATGLAGAMLLGLASFVAGAAAFLLMFRARLRGAAVLAAITALVGPIGYDLAINPQLYVAQKPTIQVVPPCPKEGCRMIDYGQTETPESTP